MQAGRLIGFYVELSVDSVSDSERRNGEVREDGPPSMRGRRRGPLAPREGGRGNERWGCRVGEAHIVAKRVEERVKSNESYYVTSLSCFCLVDRRSRVMLLEIELITRL